MNYLLDFVQAPYFTDENVEKEKGIISQEIKMYEDMPDNIIFEKSMYNLFINDPISGEKDKIILSPIIAEEYYRAYDEFQDISSNNNFTKEQIIKVVKDTLNYSKKCINKELKLNGILPTTQKIKKLEKKNEE